MALNIQLYAIRRELENQIDELNEATKAMKDELAKDQIKVGVGQSYYSMRDANGRFIMADLVAAKAMVMVQFFAVEMKLIETEGDSGA